MTDIAEAAATLAGAKSILMFTGAGISTESGIPDFRGPQGLWTKVDPDDFNISRYVASRDLRVQKWRMHADGELWGARSQARPNRGHMAIVELHRAGRLAGCVTQNIDGLHLVSGLPERLVAELHGDVRKVGCLLCRRQWPIDEVLDRVDAGEEDPDCPDCGGMLKTSTVMFGEMLPEGEMAKANTFVAAAQAVVAVGSTMGVFPVAHIPIGMALEGKPLVIVNQGPTEADYLATVRLDGAAGDLLPPLIGAIVESSSE